MESRITVSRKSPSDVKQRQVIVKLDGDPFAILMYGHAASRVVEPGKYRLLFDNTWTKKKVEFTVAEGEHVKYNVINRAGRFTWWMVAALGAGPMYLTIERKSV